MASMREYVAAGGNTTYQVLCRHGSKQTSKTFETRKSAKDFKILIEQFGPDRALRMLAGEQEPGGITVAELWEKFFEWKAPQLTPRIRKDYQRDYGNCIESWFGHRAADDVDETDVQGWVDQMGKKLAPKTVGDRHMLLHSMYEYGRARSRRLVAHNPCKETELPRRRKRKPPKGTTTVEFRAIIAAAVKRNPDAAA